ncbi:hypothetical protein KO525_07270 [Psychrosphaera sp. B3R10]|uniref:hypothetical protein n=1 Tax=Psychrosphaera sp. B3R10 TaxID=2841569 RepID=UPI001C083B1D|nr:hypothetical protein [Psychrosphaera sp. B3R10]MBU2989168.1 hypothetical protein [Psychrosphaera sp. B3R10]
MQWKFIIQLQSAHNSEQKTSSQKSQGDIRDLQPSAEECHNSLLNWLKSPEQKTSSQKSHGDIRDLQPSAEEVHSSLSVDVTELQVQKNGP